MDARVKEEEGGCGEGEEGRRDCRRFFLTRSKCPTSSGVNCNERYLVRDYWRKCSEYDRTCTAKYSTPYVGNYITWYSKFVCKGNSVSLSRFLSLSCT